MPLNESNCWNIKLYALSLLRTFKILLTLLLHKLTFLILKRNDMLQSWCFEMYGTDHQMYSATAEVIHMQLIWSKDNKASIEFNWKAHFMSKKITCTWNRCDGLRQYNFELSQYFTSVIFKTFFIYSNRLITNLYLSITSN